MAIVQRANINRKDCSLETPVIFVRQDMHLLRHQPVVRRVLDPHTKDKTVQQMLLVTRGPRVRLVSSHLRHHPFPTIVGAVIAKTVNINQQIRLLAPTAWLNWRHVLLDFTPVQHQAAPKTESARNARVDNFNQPLPQIQVVLLGPRVVLASMDRLLPHW